ncbi:TPA: hypothetical protein RQO79_003569 [Klebsiella michiganensis]|nr:hypothetical protein [Klebsiella michiganensis]
MIFILNNSKDSIGLKAGETGYGISTYLSGDAGGFNVRFLSNDRHADLTIICSADDVTVIDDTSAGEEQYFSSWPPPGY